jgi:hypothetical protein
MTRTSLAAFALAALLASAASATNTRAVEGAVRDGALPSIKNGDDFVPSGKGLPLVRPGAAGKARNRKSTVMAYHGGPLMLGTVNVYDIWYGDWSGSDAPGILTDFIANLGGSPYERIDSTYYDRAGLRPSGQLSLAVSYAVPAYLGNALSDDDVEQVVVEAIEGGHLPRDPNGVYFVLAAADVGETSGFCTQYCGWHASDGIGGTDVKFAFVGNPARCPSACEPQPVGPNGDAAADAMASIIAHEGEEAISDPDLNAWFDGRGAENADKCAWTYGTLSTAPNGARYNLTLASGRHYLIQRNWVNANGGYCAMAH